MKKTISLNLLIILTISLLNSQIIQAQNTQSLCVCCTNNLFPMFKLDFTKKFPPDKIKKAGIKEALISVKGRKNGSQTVVEKYRAHKFIFNNRGLAIRRISYNSQNKPYAKFDYEYNAAGKITKSVYYADQIKKPVTVTVYYYNKNNYLIKRANQVNGKLTSYGTTTYGLDNQGRMLKEAGSGYTFTYKYHNPSFSAIREYRSNNQLFGRSKIFYDKKWQPIKDQTLFMSPKVGKGPLPIISYKRAYSSSGQLLMYKITSTPPVLSECPEKGNQKKEFSYNKEGLIKQVVHSYQNVSCKLAFEYTK